MNKIYDIDIETIRNQYFENNLTLKEIALNYGCDAHVIKSRLNEAGYTLRSASHIPKYSHNETFFDTPNVLNSYWAGVISADGCILQRVGVSDTISLDTHYKDICQLERYKNDIQFNGPILEYKNMRTIRIHKANKLSAALHENFNIVPRKTKILTPPNINSEDCVKSFIIGYIDGDGCVRIRGTSSGNPQILLNIVGTRSLLAWIREHFNDWVPIVRSNIKFEIKGDVCSYTVVGERAYKLLTMLRGCGIVCLNRKWNRINQYAKLVGK